MHYVERTLISTYRGLCNCLKTCSCLCSHHASASLSCFLFSRGWWQPLCHVCSLTELHSLFRCLCSSAIISVLCGYFTMMVGSCLVISPGKPCLGLWGCWPLLLMPDQQSSCPAPEFYGSKALSQLSHIPHFCCHPSAKPGWCWGSCTPRPHWAWGSKCKYEPHGATTKNRSVFLGKEVWAVSLLPQANIHHAALLGGGVWFGC